MRSRALRHLAAAVLCAVAAAPMTLLASPASAALVVPPGSLYTGYDAQAAPGSLHHVARLSGARAAWNRGYAGKGVDVALIDTGVAPLPALNGRLLNGPDLSLDTMGDSLDGLDAYGHGTAMAGIIAGRDPLAPADPRAFADASDKVFLGMAPQSRIVNVKVGAHDGTADVSQVIAAIDWVVQNRNKNGMNIRVLNLSYGTDGTQEYLYDPLAYAVEAAWRKGIVVVVSAGNEGFGSPRLNNPAYDPFVIAVGASDHNNTQNGGDDFIADFSSRGEHTRRPDFMAPGHGIPSLRVRGSYLDEMYPKARVGSSLFRGSGTSHASAVVTGLVALLLQEYPQLTPDQVKALLAATGKRLETRAGELLEVGARTINLQRARGKADGVISGRIPSSQSFAPATGLGSLESARGTVHLSDGGSVLAGDIDLGGRAWSASSWTTGMFAGTNWFGASWRGTIWTGRTWSGRTWSGRTWSGRTWSGRTWSGSGWTGTGWVGRTWSGANWTGSTWSASLWGAG